jgi:1,4-alpha-glucan branching enzyme
MKDETTSKKDKRTKQDVTFAVTLEARDTLREIESVSVVGDFNHWDSQSHPLRKTEDGQWQTVIELEDGKSYQYRYLVNGQDWYTDEGCELCANPFGSENNVLTVSAQGGNDTQSLKEVEHV